MEKSKKKSFYLGDGASLKVQIRSGTLSSGNPSTAKSIMMLSVREVDFLADTTYYVCHTLSYLRRNTEEGSTNNSPRSRRML